MTQISRRDWLLTSTAFSAALFSGAARPFAQDVKPLKFGVGLKAMGPAVINTVIGEVLGYNAAEGFAIKALALGTNANVQIAIDKGDVDVGIGVPSFGLPLLAKGEWQGALNYYQYTYPYKWDVVTNPVSPIKSYTDLKGKKIGVSDLGGTETPVTKRVLASLGINPDTDVTWIPVGNGVQAGTALQRGAIDALAYFDTGFGQIEGAGIPLSFLPRPANLPMIGGQFLTAKKSFITGQRKLAVGLGRSVAKASTFLLANPEAGAAAFLKQYPETAPRGADTQVAIKSVLQAVARRIQLYKPPYADLKMGGIREAEFRTEADLGGLKIDSFATYFTNELIDEINSFDANKIAAEAKAYKI